MIFHEYKAIFVHIPKAGGTSIENFLWPNIQSRGVDSLWMGFVKPHYNKYQTGGLQHLLAKQVQTEVGDTVFSSYYKFSISRNPWDKAVSQFCFMQRRQDLRDFVGMDERDTFEKYLELIQKKEHVQWKNQLDFILDDNGERLVDDCFKLEHLSAAKENLSLRLGINIFELPHDNKGDKKSQSHYYSDETREIVSEIYKDDIQYFKYKFELR
jgi:hypothetical protein